MDEMTGFYGKKVMTFASGDSQALRPWTDESSQHVNSVMKILLLKRR